MVHYFSGLKYSQWLLRLYQVLELNKPRALLRTLRKKLANAATAFSTLRPSQWASDKLAKQFVRVVLPYMRGHKSVSSNHQASAFDDDVVLQSVTTATASANLGFLIIQAVVAYYQTGRLQEKSSLTYFLIKYCKRCEQEPALQAILQDIPLQDVINFYSPGIFTQLRRHVFQRTQWKRLQQVIKRHAGTQSEVDWIKAYWARLLQHVVEKLNGLARYRDYQFSVLNDYSGCFQLHVVSQLNKEVVKVAFCPATISTTMGQAQVLIQDLRRLWSMLERGIKIVWTSALLARNVYGLLTLVLAFLVTVLVGCPPILPALILAIAGICFLGGLYFNYKRTAGAVFSPEEVHKQTCAKVGELAKRELVYQAYFQHLTQHGYPLIPARPLRRRMADRFFNHRPHRRLLINSQPQALMRRIAPRKRLTQRYIVRLPLDFIRGLLSFLAVTGLILQILLLFGVASIIVTGPVVLTAILLGLGIGCLFSYRSYKQLVQEDKQFKAEFFRRAARKTVLKQLNEIEQKIFEYSEINHLLLVLDKLTTNQIIHRCKLTIGCMSTDEYFWQHLEPKTSEKNFQPVYHFLQGGALAVGMIFTVGFGLIYAIAAILGLGVTVTGVGGLIVMITTLIAITILGLCKVFEYYQQRQQQHAWVLVENSAFILELAKQEKLAYEQANMMLSQRLILRINRLSETALQGILKQFKEQMAGQWPDWPALKTYLQQLQLREGAAIVGYPNLASDATTLNPVSRGDDWVALESPGFAYQHHRTHCLIR